MITQTFLGGTIKNVNFFLSYAFVQHNLTHKPQHKRLSVWHLSFTPVFWSYCKPILINLNLNIRRWHNLFKISKYINIYSLSTALILHALDGLDTLMLWPAGRPWSKNIKYFCCIWTANTAIPCWESSSSFSSWAKTDKRISAIPT